MRTKPKSVRKPSASKLSASKRQRILGPLCHEIVSGIAFGAGRFLSPEQVTAFYRLASNSNLPMFGREIGEVMARFAEKSQQHTVDDLKKSQSGAVSTLFDVDRQLAMLGELVVSISRHSFGASWKEVQPELMALNLAMKAIGQSLRDVRQGLNAQGKPERE